MITYIAEFTAVHKIVQIVHHSVFIWRQEGGEIDRDLLEGKIKRESSIHFYRLLAGKNYNVQLEDISVKINKTALFEG